MLKELLTPEQRKVIEDAKVPCKVLIEVVDYGKHKFPWFGRGVINPTIKVTYLNELGQTLKDEGTFTLAVGDTLQLSGLWMGVIIEDLVGS